VRFGALQQQCSKHVDEQRVGSPVQVSGIAGLVPQVAEGDRRAALLNVHWLSSKDFVHALEGFLGTNTGLSAATATWLTGAVAGTTPGVFAKRNLSTMDHVCIFADGIHVNIRLDEEKLCLPVLVGVSGSATRSRSTGSHV
jgi:hypothetical protein